MLQTALFQISFVCSRKYFFNLEVQIVFLRLQSNLKSTSFILMPIWKDLAQVEFSLGAKRKQTPSSRLRMKLFKTQFRPVSRALLKVLAPLRSQILSSLIDVNLNFLFKLNHLRAQSLRRHAHELVHHQDRFPALIVPLDLRELPKNSEVQHAIPVTADQPQLGVGVNQLGVVDHVGLQERSEFWYTLILQEDLHCFSQRDAHDARQRGVIEQVTGFAAEVF